MKKKLNQIRNFILLLTTMWLATPAFAKIVHYDLKATKGTINLSGKKSVDWALMINGGIPAPTLEFTEGDDAEITVHNQLTNEEVSIHWHGILLPPEMDGVPYLNTPPILPGSSYTFRFKIRQHGTYWYHSHTKLQEQKGIFGAIVIHPREKKIAYDKDLVVVISDWSDENADDIIKNLRKDGDYYLYKKNSLRSVFGAMQAGALSTYVSNEWTRMGGMDVSDVGYDAFLINGKGDSKLLDGAPGQKVRIRIINASASSYFHVSLGQEPMKVISADGMDVEPILAKELLMGMAETYDVIFEIPKGKSTELRATAQDITGFASGWIGSGDKVSAPTKANLNLYESMSHGGTDHSKMNHQASPHAAMNHKDMTSDDMNHMEHMDHDDDEHNHESDNSSAAKEIPTVESLTVDNLKSPVSTAFPKNTPTFELKLVLGGDMERYIWHINGKAIHEDRTIEVRQGDVVRFTFQNESMMHHPMHLHGHFFRVLNENGDFSPLKHTVDVPAHGSRTIEFLANEPGEWMLHCHNLYHMKTGMARVLKYTSFTPKPEMAAHQAHDPHRHDHIYMNGMVELATNHAKANLRLSRTWDAIEGRVGTQEFKDNKNIEGELLYRRWTSNFLNIIVGVSYFPEFEKDKTRGLIGLGYTLPMLIDSNLFLDHKGQFRLDLEKRIQWTQSIFSDVEVSFRQTLKPEFGASLMYGPEWAWAAGLMLDHNKLGAGLKVRF